MKAIDLDNLLFRPVTNNEPLNIPVYWTGKRSIIVLKNLSSWSAFKGTFLPNMGKG
jgi:hypothetical protein